MLSGPAGEPSNARRLRGPRREEASLQRRASPLFRVADLCPILRSPQAQGRVVTARRCGRVRRRPLNTSSAGRGSEGRGRPASYRKSLGGASLSRGPVRHSWPRLVFLPQALGPCSALPTVHQGRVLLLFTGRRPPTASDPSQMLQCCPGGLRCAPGAATLVPSPRRARLLGGHRESWPDHTLCVKILTESTIKCVLKPKFSLCSRNKTIKASKCTSEKIVYKAMS
ncbi:hypothetical protein NDU88_004847 [Pleurodeles waltl]|uniref:Uncharacterized protein n=1 Tax=Pleurodeles waltl TaxID=8319 RepID=A0AAV7T8L8_PLEWA|nr:hypothetical protein NDU88_004847 [Pleurodeles waltl]